MSFDYIAVVIDKPSRNADSNLLSFWKPGMLYWTTINTNEPVIFVDVVFFNGRFYALDRRHRVLALNLDHHDDDRDRTVSVVSELSLPKWRGAVC